jgi:methyl acetate hydrolase
MSLCNEVNDVLRRAAAAGDVPGVVAMVTDHHGPIYEEAFGALRIGESTPMELDTVGLLASMTKAITSAAAMQLVEQRKLELNTPAARWVPELGKIQVLEGFDVAGKPRLRAPKRSITLRHLLTHTAGFSYDFLSAEVQQYQAATSTPSFLSCALSSICLPLLFDPGERWSYGASTDWVGRMVEAASGLTLNEYFARHLFAPLGMTDTAIRMSPGMRKRLASIHARSESGTLTPIDLVLTQEPECAMGGHGLYGTMRDYLKFVRMILNHGEADGGRVLTPETVDAMSRNQIGELDVPAIKSANKQYTNDTALLPDNPQKWSLAFMINTKDLPTGRKGGSLAWAGLCNSYYWIDPASGIGGVFLTQVLPYADVKAMPLFFEFEQTVYQNL